ncbi:maleylpyruvate isomerase family mycothiol-dependent enzyme [Ornithinimicrobium sp. F0845]|uniref:maleylpyruvate isomerase family mycothiol-dependent enzyme n=1 Tax=Ornithinimicrobium sp. F0845 TaxID=2926412 RepID=UPI001FF5AAC3|nr:maleylpyruvate isomerase family mycothiol-dependent enzyme [Ornithinimicrobium sp. F0845]MCK0113307.1 maleylpyruvate isomerase family mycothiol-dependent enzyme [Ornithinimicrobium sp. F0845]
MSGEHYLTAGRAIDLLAEADAALAKTISTFTQDDLRHPSLCDGWTRAHVLGHLARNADGLRHLAQWAVSGHETPMYASIEQRNADIEEAATQPVARLRADVLSASDAIRTRLEQLRGRSDLNDVALSTGKRLAGDQLPWARLREVTFHHVDLDAGYTFHDAPPEVVRAGLAEAVDRLGHGSCPPLSLTGSDNRHWHIHGGGHEVKGRPGDLLLWLARGVEHGLTHQHPLPTMPRWG